MDKNLEVISIFGWRGTGKSTLTKEMLNRPKRRRIIVYDVKDEYAFKKVRGIHNLAKFLKENWYKPFKISYVSGARETPEHIKALSDMCYMICEAQKKDEAKGKGNNITIVAEEMSVSAPNQKYPHGQGGFPYAVNIAREWGVEIIGISQRPAQVNTDFRGNASHCFYFGLNDKLDVDAVKTKLPDQADKLLTLPKYTYFERHNGKVTKRQTRK